MSDFKLYAYRIPDIYFQPHKVVSPFRAKVVYSIVDGKAKIEEIAFSDNCLDYLTGQSQMIKDIRKKLDAIVANNHVDETIMSAIAPHII